MLPKRQMKGKGHPPPGDFIALGSKARSGSDPEIKSGNAGQVQRGFPPKREPGSVPGASLMAKKPKMVTQTFTPLGRSETERRPSPTPQIMQYEEIAQEVDPSELMDAITEAEEDLDDERVESLLCGAVKYLKMNRAKPDPAVFLTLMYLGKARPLMFGSEVVIEAFCSLLKRDVSINFKTKSNALVSVLACNVLTAAFIDEENWPDSFMKVYVEDSLGERVWVDRPDCKGFVDNIQTAFNTKMPKISMLTDQGQMQASCPSPTATTFDEEDRSLESVDSLERPGSSIASLEDVNVFPRYTYQLVSIETYVLDVLKENMARRQGMVDSVSRNVLRVMTAACGFPDVRVLAAQKLEMWLQNPKLAKPAQDLLMAVCLNCDQHSQVDVEVMSQLSKIRLKTKPLSNHYMLCIRELLSQHPENLHTMMTHTVYNELSTSRNPNNMPLITVMMQHAPESTAKILAEIFQDLLTNRDDYLRALRALMREIVRAVRSEINFPEFCRGLMQERKDSKFVDMDALLKDRFLKSITDLITLTAFLSVTPAVREAASAHVRGDQKDLEILRSFQNQVAVIQRDAIWWLHTVVPKMFPVKVMDYAFCLRKVLMMEKQESYYKVDNWPSETDRAMVLRLVSEVPVLEDTLMRVLVIGLTKELSVAPGDAVELADQLVKRAAMLHADGFEVLQVERLELIDALLNLCAYRYPENITLPKGYQPPTLAISNQYWKAWVMLLIIASYNPATFGMAAWENYPTLKCMMEMTMTNNFRFPPPTMTTEEKEVDDIKTREKQIWELEKHSILEFETHLAAATSKVTITESNSLLLAQLTSMDPGGVARKPPAQILEQLRSLNQSLHLGRLLCGSRSPNFLLDIIQRQGTSQSMPWLAELVESSEGSLDVLPVQCLCEFLLHESPLDLVKDDDEDESKADRQKRKQKQRKQEQLLSRLQSLLHSSSGDTHTLSEILDYFLRRLSSQQASARQLAVKGLSMVLSKSHIQQSEEFEEDMEVEDSVTSSAIPSHRWLLVQLPALPLFHTIKTQACAAFRKACQVETDVNAVSAYIVFLAEHTKNFELHDLDDMVLDLAQLIVERATLMNSVLPAEVDSSDERATLVQCAMITLFYNYLLKAQKPEKEAYSWSNTQDQILLQWASGKSATMNILVVHAMIILLTFGKPNGESDFHKLLNAWFPEDGPPPSAYLVDTSEEALLLPDWLKLRMIRSNTGQLVDAALLDLESSQLLLFVVSFGIPVDSMSKLLSCLDQAVVMDSYAMEQVDKAYMAQLIQVQHMRGAKGGEKFYATLTEGQDRSDTEASDVEMTTPIRRTRNLSQLSRAPDLSITHNQDEVMDLLFRVFGGGKGEPLQGVEKQKTFRALQKSLLKDSSCAETMVLTLNKVLNSSSCSQFVSGLRKQLHLACALFRILVSKQKGNSVLVSVMEALLRASREDKTALTNLARQYLADVRGESQQLMVQVQVQMMKQGQPSVQPDRFAKVVQLGEAQRDSGLESLVNACMEDSMKTGDTSSQVQATCGLLLDTEHRSASPLSASGLLVDWLELLDPELVQACPELEQQLVFAKKQVDKSKEERDANQSKSCQPYLLALLTHQSSWSSLHRCVDLIASSHRLERFHPTAALDFLWACIHIPKIWQGRDKKLPKNHQPEDVLHLTVEQLICIVGYMIQEAQLVNDGAEGVSVQSAVVECIDKRMSLLLICCHNNGALIRGVIDYLYSRIKLNGEDYSICQHLLLELYVHVPHVLGVMDANNLLLKHIHTTNRTSSQLDAISHRLLSALSNCKHGKSNESRMYDANIACRKMAAEHPLLLLRQLPMISAMLQGRAQFTFGQMVHRNHLLLYTYVLGILELLQPYIFHKEYAALEGTLEAYFDLLKHHGLDNRQLAPIVNKFVKFLHNFMSHDSSRACGMLQQHVALLSAICSQYPDFAMLKSLLAGLSLPRTIPNQSREESPTEGASGLPVARPSSPWTVSQLAPFLQRISKSASTQDTLDVLKDLDETSKRKVDILQHFLGDLKRLMCDTNDTCRNTAHALVMRHLRQNPGSAQEFVSPYLHCLDSSNQDVVGTALRNLAEFALLAEEHAATLLLKAFIVGIHTKVETGSFISEALQLLNMETMQ